MDPALLYIFAFFFGAIVGSFLNVCIYRIPRGESIRSPRSHCPHCREKIRWYDNIPIVSFFLLKGRCRNCNQDISLQYPLVELLTAIFCVLLFDRFSMSMDFVRYFIFVAALIVVTGIDIPHRIIPHGITIPGIAVGFAFSFVPPHMDPLNSVMGIVAGAGSLLLIYWGYGNFVWLHEEITGKKSLEETDKLLKELSLEELKREAAIYGIETENLKGRKQIIKAISEARTEGMGGGDINLFAMIGAFLGGWSSILFIILVASFLGCVVGVPLRFIKGRDSKYAIPFGPFLSMGAVIYLFFGREIIRWYLNFRI